MKRHETVYGEAGADAPPAPVGVRFDEAIAWFRSRIPMTREEWDDLNEKARRRAFTVSGVAQLDVVNDTMAALDKAVAEGHTLAEFKKEIAEKLEREWQGTVASPATRLETIYRTNTQHAYSAGRYAQATDEAVLAARPYWRFDAVLDPRTSDICRPLNGKIVAADSAWWHEHTPPLHFNCRSTFVTLTKAQAEKAGVTAEPPEGEPQKGFGAPGWDDAALEQFVEEKKAAAAAELREVADTKPEMRPPADEIRPREVQPLREGEHYDKIVETALTPEQEAEVLRLANTPLVARVLALQPEKVKFAFPLRIDAPDLPPNQFVPGDYDPQTRTIRVGTTRPEGSFGQGMRPGKTGTVSQAGATWLEGLARTLVHEVAHTMPGGIDDDDVPRAIRRAFREKKQTFTQYGRTRAREYFAELFAAYNFHRAELAEFDPAGYSAIESVLVGMGVIEPTDSEPDEG